MTGLHRHFISDVTRTLQGVESIVLQGRAFEDYGERVVCTSCSAGSLEPPLSALQVNETHRLSVRILRPLGGDARGPHAIQKAQFRYDGVYLVQCGADPDNRQVRAGLGAAPGGAGLL